MVHSPSTTKKGIKVWNEFLVGYQISERLAPGLFPGQHTCDRSALVLAIHAKAVHFVVLCAFVLVSVNGFIKCLDLPGSQEVFDPEVAPQIEEEFFMFIHIILHLLYYIDLSASIPLSWMSQC